MGGSAVPGVDQLVRGLLWQSKARSLGRSRDESAGTRVDQSVQGGLVGPGVVRLSKDGSVNTRVDQSAQGWIGPWVDRSVQGGSVGPGVSQSFQGWIG